METREPQKTATGQNGKENMLNKLQVNLEKLESELSAACKKLYDVNIELHEARNVVENILSLIPQIRRDKARINLKTALTKYKSRLTSYGVNPSLWSLSYKKEWKEYSAKLSVSLSSGWWK